MKALQKFWGSFPNCLVLFLGELKGIVNPRLVAFGVSAPAGQCLSLPLIRNSHLAFVTALFSLVFETRGKHSSVQRLSVLNVLFSK